MKYNYLIVGGGTAGYITALMLKTAYPEKNIAIIKSDKLGIVGVGEGSTKEFKNFIDFINVTPYDIIKNCGATFKSGIYFKDWSKKPFLHTRSSFHDKNWLDLKPYYLYHVANDCEDPLSDACYLDNKFYPNFLEAPVQSPVNQYHFDTFKLNEFFYNLALERNIIVIDDIIEQVKEEDKIISIKGNKEYFADFYFDCTGFRRLLNKSKWKSYSNRLILNKAVAFQTEEMVEYNAWTLAKKYKGGWRWKIPTQTRTGNGIVYQSDLIDDEIKKLIDLGRRQFDFNPGRQEEIWYKNCLSVGLSAMFVEPLEATSIGSTINQIFMFLNICNQKKYNYLINNVFDQLVDFIQMHYFNSELEGEVPIELQEKLKEWKEVLPTSSDVSVPYGLFHEGNYIEILYGLRLLNIKKIKEKFEKLPEYVKHTVSIETKKFIEHNLRSPKIGHKEAIHLILKYY